MAGTLTLDNRTRKGLSCPPRGHLLPYWSGRPARAILSVMNTSTENPDSFDTSLAGARAWFEENGLSRPRQGRVLGGVTAGLARRFGVNLLVARVAMVAGAVVLTPLLYIPLWILMPDER
jgi:phage shock protein PspC (stress-responsive transcriptional regulator)